jgi:hypothetical protein
MLGGIVRDGGEESLREMEARKGNGRSAGRKMLLESCRRGAIELFLFSDDTRARATGICASCFFRMGR